MDIHATRELSSNHVAYSSLVPKEVEASELMDLERILERHPPMQEAVKVVNKDIGSEIMDPIIC